MTQIFNTCLKYLWCSHGCD